MAIEMVSCPIQVVIFHSYVKLPEGKVWVYHSVSENRGFFIGFYIMILSATIQELQPT